MNASSAPAGRAEIETIGSSQGGAVDAPPVPVGRAKSATNGSSYGGTADASSVSVGRAETTSAQHQLPAPIKGTVMIPPRSCRGGKLMS